MRYFHGAGKSSRYFEGWYFKHCSQQSAIAFIPGFSVGKNGDKSVFIQVITPERSYFSLYPADSFQASKDKLYIRIADNLFGRDGISVNINNDMLSVRGRLEYGKFREPERDIMGPFRFVPFMQCNHGIISMLHDISGALTINGREMSFDDGVGYIETDWGCSFPKSYLWTQLSGSGNNRISIMSAVADIPFAGTHFKGCIAVVYMDGREYRLTTYNRVKILGYRNNAVTLKQGKYTLEIEAFPKTLCKLYAPLKGDMSREIRESLCCEVNARFYIDNNLVFDLKDRQAGFEFVGDNKITPGK